MTQEPTRQVPHPHPPFISLLDLETGEARNLGGGSDQKKNSDRQRQAHPSLQSQRGEHCPGLSRASGPKTQVRGGPLETASMVVSFLHRDREPVVPPVLSELRLSTDQLRQQTAA